VLEAEREEKFIVAHVGGEDDDWIDPATLKMNLNDKLVSMDVTTDIDDGKAVDGVAEPVIASTRPAWTTGKKENSDSEDEKKENEIPPVKVQQVQEKPAEQKKAYVAPGARAGPWQVKTGGRTGGSAAPKIENTEEFPSLAAAEEKEKVAKEEERQKLADKVTERQELAVKAKEAAEKQKLREAKFEEEQRKLEENREMLRRQRDAETHKETPNAWKRGEHHDSPQHTARAPVEAVKSPQVPRAEAAHAPPSTGKSSYVPPHLRNKQ